MADADDRYHALRLFDDPDSLADGVADFLYEGFLRGDAVLVVMRPELWNLTAAHLRRDCVPLRELIAKGQLSVLDSDRTLARFTCHGTPDPVLFDAVVGDFVRQLRATHRRVRIYGDMVDILAGDGDFENARRLEALWNRLQEQETFALLCGYLAPHFADARGSAALEAICGSHSQVEAGARDTLSPYLLDRTA